MDESNNGKRAPLSDAEGRVYTPEPRETSKEHGGRELFDHLKEKVAMLKDLPEEVKNYYSQHGSGSGLHLDQHAEAGSDLGLSQGDGPNDRRAPASTPTRGHDPKMTSTSPRSANAAPDEIIFAQQQGSGSGHADHLASNAPGPNQSSGPPPGSKPAPGPTPAPGPSPTPAPDPKPRKSPPGKVPHHRFLPGKEWALIAHGLGGIVDRESQTPIHPTNWWWPPKGMPRGLYRDVVTQRVWFSYAYQITSWFRLILMFMQLLIGAVLTAIGTMQLKDGIPITVLGATNTTIAGLLAFLQNSGLPERYRYDKAEFEALEDRIKELLDSGIAPADRDSDQILAECFSLFQDAKTTVNSNLPANYNTQLGQTSSSQNASDVATPAPQQPSPKSSSADNTEKRG